MAKKKLTKKVVEDEVMEDPIKWCEPIEGKIDGPEPLPPSEMGAFFRRTILVPVELVTTQKTFFDFTYRCCHPENSDHCIECYNKARKG